VVAALSGLSFPVRQIYFIKIITIGNKDYDLDRWSGDAKDQLQMMQFAHQEVVWLDAQLAIVPTLSLVVSNALLAALPAKALSDTIKLS